MTTARPELDDVVRRALEASPRLGTVRMVAIDGPAGSGKTTLAAAIAERVADAGERVAVVHVDDLLEGWGGLGDVWDRLYSSVLEPLSRGESGRYRRYDWDADDWAEWHDVPVPDVLVVEGCGAAPRAADPLAVLRLWVEAPEAVRLQRGMERDGEALRDQWLRWMRSESVLFAAERTRERADLRFTT